MVKPTPPETIARIREMAAQGTDRAAIAAAIGCDPRTVLRYARGIYTPPFPQSPRIGMYLAAEIKAALAERVVSAPYKGPM